MKKKGFTLVELIIVIAVIGILVAILIPVFANVIEKANSKSALSDARNLIEQYVLEENTRINENRAGLPENVCILVYKGGKFYAYGYNTKVGGALMISDGNPYTASDLQDCIDRYSWNNSDAHRGIPYDPTVDQETLDSYTIDADGAFYLVPYVGANSANAKVRGIHTRDISAYPASYEDEEYRLLNYEMEYDMGEGANIFHGCLVGASFTYDTTGSDTTTTEPQPQTEYTVTYSKGDIPEAVVLAATNEDFVSSYTVTNGEHVVQGAIKSAIANSEYTFAGWYFGNGTEATGIISVTSDITLTAHWTVSERYTVTLAENGGTYTDKPSEFGSGLTWSAPKNTSLNDIISALGITPPSHKSLQGWKIAMGGSEVSYVSSNTYTLTADATITPQFDQIFHTVTFDLDGGSGTFDLTMQVADGESFTFPTPAPTKENFNFLGWTYDDTVYNGSSYTDPVETDMTFTAEWGSYNVTFYQHDGTTSITTTHNGNTYTVPTGSVQVPTGFTFDGWTVSPSGAPACDKNATSYTADRNNISLTAKLKANTYTVTFKNSYNEAVISTSTVNHGNAVAQPGTPAAPAGGYTFARWSLTKNGTEPYIFSTVVTSDLTIWAVWADPAEQTQACTVTFYDCWNEETVGSTTAALTIGDDITTSAVAAAGGTVPEYFTNEDGYEGTDEFAGCTQPTVVSGTSSYTVYGRRHNTAVSGDTGTDYIVVSSYVGLMKIGSYVVEGSGSDQYCLVPIHSNSYVQAMLDANYWLLNDITLSAYSFGAFGWSSDGSQLTTNYTYNGKFDGNGHTLSMSGLLNVSGNYMGLFAENRGTIRNVTFSGLRYSGTSYTYLGAAAGVNHSGGLIENVTTTNCMIQGYQYVGGIAGYNSGGTIRNCKVSLPNSYSVYASLENSTSTDSCAGGITGYNASTSTISYCCVLGTSTNGVYGYNKAGGIVAASTGTVEKCYSNADVCGYARIGGIVGYAGGGTVSECGCTGTVNLGNSNYGNTSACGGIAGLLPSGGATIRDCYFANFQSGSSKVLGGMCVGGMVGQMSGGELKYCYSYLSSVAYNSSYSGYARIGVGYKDGGTVTNSYVCGSTNSTQTQYVTGGFTSVATFRSTASMWDWTDVWNDESFPFTLRRARYS